MKKIAGFTLIELMVVVVVIGILASVAYPSYSDYVVRGRLSEPRAKLSEMRTRLEQYYQDRRTYLGACAAGTVAPLPSDGQFFQYTCPTLLADSYVVRAEGIASQAVGGFRFEIDQSGVRSTRSAPEGWATSDTCWIRDRAGSC